MQISIHETQWLEKDGSEMLMKLGVKEGHRVIDFGSGEGRYTIPLSQIVGERGRVYSIERDEKALSIAKERLPLFSNPDLVTFIENDSVHNSNIIKEKSIDAIFAFDVLQYVDDWDELFRYFLSVLKPTGIVCIYPAEIPHPGSMDIKLITTKMEKIGFRYERAHTFRMMHNINMVEDVVYCFVTATNTVEKK